MYICVYGSARDEIAEVYRKKGYELGKEIAKQGHSLVFGGGSEGMMGAVARGVFDNKGEIHGIAPVWMKNFEGIFKECDRFIFTKSMDERKNLFLKESDAFIITPGGIGTLDEFFEIMTLKKLNQHNKPIIIYNINHFFDEMLTMINEMINKNFLSKESLDLIQIIDNIEDIKIVLEDLK